MEHRQFGYVFAIVLGGGGTLIVANCSLDRYDINGTCHDFNNNGTCDIYESDAGVAGSGGTTSSSSSGGTAGSGNVGGSMGGSAGSGGEIGGSGGTGGTILAGGGGAGGSGGTILSGGSGGVGGQGGGMDPVLCGPDQVPIPATGLVVCWHIDLGHDIPGTTLGLGGLIQEPGSPTVAQSPFTGCVTSTPSENTLVCPFGNLAVGTDFVFDPYATDGSTTYWRCDQKGLPTSKCFGEYWVFVDGVEISSFVDPPTGRWTYNTAGAYLRLVYTDPG